MQIAGKNYSFFICAEAVFAISFLVPIWSKAISSSASPLSFMTDLGQSWADVDVIELPSDGNGCPLAVINAAARFASQQRARITAAPAVARIKDGTTSAAEFQY